MDRKENGFVLLDQSTNRVYMAQSDGKAKPVTSTHKTP
jgi:hypothetical protein